MLRGFEVSLACGTIGGWRYAQRDGIMAGAMAVAASRPHFVHFCGLIRPAMQLESRKLTDPKVILIQKLF